MKRLIITKKPQSQKQPQLNVRIPNTLRVRLLNLSELSGINKRRIVVEALEKKLNELELKLEKELLK